MICFLDPSSTRTGYALFRDDGTFVEAGAFAPTRGDDANARILAMTWDLAELVSEHHVGAIVIEDTSGKVGDRHTGGGAGLSVYGKAVGYFLARAEALCPGAVEAVPENAWTSGVAKVERALRTRLTLPQVRDSEDLDALDAAGLGLWWFERKRCAAIFNRAKR